MRGGRIDPKSLPRNEEGFAECRYCSGSIVPPRRTFCSPECVHQYRLRTSGTYLRRVVYERDHGVCAVCGLDTKSLAKQINGSGDQEREFLIKEYKLGKRKIHKRKLGGGLWDADHILPVHQGGGACDLDNLRTLCIGCHKIVTKSARQKKS